MSAEIRVFVSYAHESSGHMAIVASFVDALRQDGVEAIFDKDMEVPPEGWPRWTERQIRESDFVLLIPSKTYAKRLRGEESEGAGLGAIWEGHLIYQALYLEGLRNERFIPVILNGCSIESVPEPLQGTTYYRISDFTLQDEGYELLYRRITKQPKRKPVIVHDVHRLDAGILPEFMDSEAAIQLIEKYSHEPERVVREISKELPRRGDPTERYWLYVVLGQLQTDLGKIAVQQGLRDPNQFSRKGAENAIERWAK